MWLQVCLVGMKTCSHMALYWISLTPLLYMEVFNGTNTILILLFLGLDSGKAGLVGGQLSHKFIL